MSRYPLHKVVGSNLRCIDHRSRAMPKRTLIPLPDKIAAAMLQARTSITAALDNRLVLQTPDIDRPPGYDRKTDYRVLWRGKAIGRIWMHDYAGERWAG